MYYNNRENKIDNNFNQKTRNNKRKNVFLIIGLISLGLSLFFPLAILISILFVLGIGKILGGFKNVSVMESIMSIPHFLSKIQGGINFIIIPAIIGIVFIIISLIKKK